MCVCVCNKCTRVCAGVWSCRRQAPPVCPIPVCPTPNRTCVVWPGPMCVYSLPPSPWVSAHRAALHCRACAGRQVSPREDSLLHVTLTRCAITHTVGDNTAIGPTSKIETRHTVRVTAIVAKPCHGVAGSPHRQTGDPVQPDALTLFRHAFVVHLQLSYRTVQSVLVSPVASDMHQRGVGAAHIFPMRGRATFLVSPVTPKRRAPLPT